jgi:hypothetical protein
MDGAAPCSVLTRLKQAEADGGVGLRFLIALVLSCPLASPENPIPSFAWPTSGMQAAIMDGWVGGLLCGGFAMAKAAMWWKCLQNQMVRRAGWSGLKLLLTLEVDCRRATSAKEKVRERVDYQHAVDSLRSTLLLVRLIRQPRRPSGPPPPTHRHPLDRNLANKISSSCSTMWGETTPTYLGEALLPQGSKTEERAPPAERRRSYFVLFEAGISHFGISECVPTQHRCRVCPSGVVCGRRLGGCKNAYGCQGPTATWGGEAWTSQALLVLQKLTE